MSAAETGQQFARGMGGGWEVKYMATSSILMGEQDRARVHGKVWPWAPTPHFYQQALGQPSPTAQRHASDSGTGPAAQNRQNIAQTPDQPPPAAAMLISTRSHGKELRLGSEPDLGILTSEAASTEAK